MIKGRIVSGTLVFLLCAGLLTGCGGEYAGVSENGAVSGGVVSGSVVSGQAVVEEAVMDKKANELSGKKDRTNWFCSEKNFYYLPSTYSKDKFVEHNLTDGTEREIKRENFWDLCYVDNDWVYYVVQGNSEKEDDKLFRAPIEDDRVKIKKEECLFADKDLSCQVYCDGRYLLYIMDSGKYRKYDLKQKKDIGTLYKDKKDYESDILAVVNDYVYLRLGEKGLYRQKLDSDKITKITKETVWGTAMAVMGEDVYYSEEYAMPFHIMRYDPEDGSTEEVVSEQQIATLLQENHVLGEKYPDLSSNIKTYDPVGMFACGERMYVQLEVEWEDRSSGYPGCMNIVFYLEPDINNELHYVRELTECLAADKPTEGYAKKYYSRGRCVEMTEDKCYMEIYNPETDKDTLASYDFGSGKFTYLTDKEMEWYLPYYVAPHQMMEKLFEDMPGYKDADWRCSDMYW